MKERKSELPSRPPASTDEEPVDPGSVPPEVLAAVNALLRAVAAVATSRRRGATSPASAAAPRAAAESDPKTGTRKPN